MRCQKREVEKSGKNKKTGEKQAEDSETAVGEVGRMRRTGMRGTEMQRGRRTLN